MIIKDFLKNSKLTRSAYFFLKQKKINRLYKSKINSEYTFINRSANKEKMCIILAGYKEFLYEAIFTRIKNFSESDIDFCVVSSGKYSEELSIICKANNWSYLSTKKNNVSLVQNLAIHLHPSAKYIYKLDEDIFITKNYFSTMFDTLQKVESEGDYNIGFVAPLILINGYSTLTILKKLNLRKEYEQRFGKLYHAHGDNQMIQSNPHAAEFMWGANNIVPHIDEINEKFQSEKFSYSACPVRFSIGAILFRREVWEDMGMFTVHKKSNDMGSDEAELCNITMSDSKGIIVCENSVVGHLSFGKQNGEMKEFFFSHPERFNIQDIEK